MQGQDFILASFQDITERKRAEAALRESEASLKGAQQIAQLGSFEFDFASETWKSSRVLDKLLGIDAAWDRSLAGWLALVHPDDRTRMADYGKIEVIGRTATFDQEYRIIRPADGAVRWLWGRATLERDANGRAVRMYGTSMDITERKQAEVALRESEANYRSVVESASDGIFIVDAGGRYLDGNELGCQMLGYTRKELLAMTLSDIVVAENQSRLAPELARLRVGAIVRSEWMYRRKDGTQFPGEVSGTVLPDGRNIGIMRDITERKQAEAALRESEEKFRTLADLVPQMVWMCTPDGLNIYFNQRWVDYTGMSLHESYGRGWNTPFHNDDKQKAWDAWNHAVASGETYQVESRLRAADGSYRWFLMQGTPLCDASGSIVKWFGTCTDIEDLKQAEMSLRESEAKLNEAQHNAHIGSWRYLPPDRFIWSDEMYDLFKLPREVPITYAAALSVVHPEDLGGDYRGAFRMALESGMADFSSEYRVIWPDGQVRWMASLGHIRRDTDGQAIEAFGTVQDITDRIQVEKQLRQSEKDLRALATHIQTIREEERKEMARDVHDDLGQKLTALRYDISAVAKLGSSNGDGLRERLMAARQLVDDSIQTVRQLAARLRPALLDDLGLAAALKWEAERFEKRTGILCGLELEDIPGLSAECTTTFFRIFQEILTNVARHAKATHVEARLKAQSGSAVLQVIDNGVGATHDEMNRPGHFGVMGMRERVLAHRGSVTFQGIKGHGVTVTVSIPLQGKQAESEGAFTYSAGR